MSGAARKFEIRKRTFDELVVVVLQRRALLRHMAAAVLSARIERKLTAQRTAACVAMWFLWLG